MLETTVSVAGSVQKGTDSKSQRDGLHASRGTDSTLVADVRVSASQIHVAQLQATIRSAHALLKAGLNHVDKFTKYNAFHDYYLF